jgi:hypothetical protein
MRMSRTREIAIGAAWRWVLGILGLVALASGVLLAATELRRALGGVGLAWLAAGVLLVVALGGASLLRSAVRGRLAIRSHQRAETTRAGSRSSRRAG